MLLTLVNIFYRELIGERCMIIDKSRCEWEVSEAYEVISVFEWFAKFDIKVNIAKFEPQIFFQNIFVNWQVEIA